MFLNLCPDRQLLPHSRVTEGNPWHHVSVYVQLWNLAAFDEWTKL